MGSNLGRQLRSDGGERKGRGGRRSSPEFRARGGELAGATQSRGSGHQFKRGLNQEKEEEHCSPRGEEGDEEAGRRARDVEATRWRRDGAPVENPASGRGGGAFRTSCAHGDGEQGGGEASGCANWRGGGGLPAMEVVALGASLR